MDFNAIIVSLIPSLSGLSPDLLSVVSGSILIVLLSIFSGTLRQILCKGG